MCLVWLLVSQGLFFWPRRRDYVRQASAPHSLVRAGEIPVQYAHSLEHYSIHRAVRAYSACRYGNLLAEWPLAAA